LLYDGPLLCGFNVAIKGLITELWSKYSNVFLLPKRHCQGAKRATFYATLCFGVVQYTYSWPSRPEADVCDSDSGWWEGSGSSGVDRRWSADGYIHSSWTDTCIPEQAAYHRYSFDTLIGSWCLRCLDLWNAKIMLIVSNMNGTRLRGRPRN